MSESDLILCYQDGEPLPYRVCRKLLFRTLRPIRSIFPAQSFDDDDLIQEALIGLLPFIPFHHPAVFCKAARYKLLDFHRTLNTKSHDRGGQPRASLSGHHGTDNEYAESSWLGITDDPSQELESRDFVQWAKAQLSASEFELLWNGTVHRREWAVLDEWADKHNTSSASASIRLKGIKKLLRKLHDGEENPKKLNRASPKDRRPSKVIQSIRQNDQSMDRQRIIKRLAGAR